MKQGINRRVVNKVVLRVSQVLLFVVFWVMSYSIVKAFEQDQRAISVLQYHHVSDETPFLTSIKPQDFEAHLDYLVQNDFEVISLSAFIEQLQSQTIKPQKTAVITFDDAYRSIHDIAWPMLKQRNMPFVVFVNTKAVEQKLKHSMTWDQMRAMANEGVEFANHTETHVHLIRSLEGESQQAWLARIRSEIEGAEAKIQQELGQSHKALAYPFGEYNPEVKSLLKEMGFVGFAQHSGAAGVMTDLQAIPRFPFGGYYTSLDDFKTKVNALALPVSNVQMGDAVGLLKDNVESPSEQVPAQIDVPEMTELPEMNKLGWLYSHQSAQPSAYFELNLTKAQGRQIACYASGQGRVPLALVGKEPEFHGFLVETEKLAPVGRSRFNCTLPSQWRGRFYWFSQPVIRLAEKDQWYPE